MNKTLPLLLMVALVPPALLLNASVSNAQSTEQDYPLHDAARRCDLQAVHQLLEAGADPNERDRSGRTALHYAVRRPTPRDPSDSGCFPQEWEPLSREGRTKQAALVAALIDSGADLNAVDEAHGGATPLREAAAGFNPEVVELLLESGADPNAGGASPLVAALQTAVEVALQVTMGDPIDDEARDVVVRVSRLLLDAGVDPDPDYTATYGYDPLPPLYYAAFVGAVLDRPKMVRLLLDAGADPNATGDPRDDEVAGKTVLLLFQEDVAADEAFDGFADPAFRLDDQTVAEIESMLREAGAVAFGTGRDGVEAADESSWGVEDLPGLDAAERERLGLDDDVVFHPDVRYLPADRAVTATVTDDALSFPKQDNPWLSEVSEGDVLWSPSATSWEHLFARRVTAVEHGRDRVTFRTREVALNEIFASVSLGTDDEATREPAGQPGLTSGSSDHFVGASFEVAADELDSLFPETLDGFQIVDLEAPLNLSPGGFELAVAEYRQNPIVGQATVLRILGTWEWHECKGDTPNRTS